MRGPKLYRPNKRGQSVVDWYPRPKQRERKTFTDRAEAELLLEKLRGNHEDKSDLILKKLTIIEERVAPGKITELEEKIAKLRDELEALRRRRPEIAVSEEFQSVAGNTEGFKSAVQIVRPELEKVVGHRPAIALQQLSWLLAQGFGAVLADGRQYIYNTYPQWQASYFQNWSIPTIKRVFRSLEKGGWIDSKQPEGRTSRRKYYTLSPEGIKLIHSGETKGSKCAVEMDQIDPKIGSKRSLPTSTKNENTTKRLIAPDGEQKLLGEIEACLSPEEMKKNGGMWRTRIRGGASYRRSWSRRHFDKANFPGGTEETGASLRTKNSSGCATC